jgi:hypothetical protein
MTAQNKFRGGGRRLEMMRRRLDLTDEQVDTLREKMAEHRRQGLAIVRDVLTDEQRAQFDAHLDRARQRFDGRGRGRGHRHGHGGPGGRGPGWGGPGGGWWFDEADADVAPDVDAAAPEPPAGDAPTDVA